MRTTREHGNVCINGQRSPRTHTRDVIPLRFQSKRRHLLSSKACPVGPVLVDCHHSDDAARAAIAGHGQREGILHKGLALLLGHALLVVGVAVAVNVRAAAAANGKRLLDQGAPDGNAEYLETKKRGFNTTYYIDAFHNLPEYLYDDYNPTDQDRQILLKRLKEKDKNFYKNHK